MAGSLSAGGNLSTEHSRVIKDGHTNILCVIVGGSITPPAKRIVSQWQDVAALLSGAKAGDVQINTGPIRAEAQSFFHTLSQSQYPKCRSLFQERPTIPPPTPFGVPAGTVIAWFPSAARGEVKIDPATRRTTIIPPNGWALCDGTNQTPNLVDKFVRGTNKFEELGSIGGKDTHTHTVSGVTSHAGYIGSGPFDPGLAANTSRDHSHDISVTSSKESHIPPFNTLVYIIRL
jgi:hypothetical protein